MPTSRSVVLIIPMMVLLNIFYTGSAQAASTCKEIPLDSLSFCSKVGRTTYYDDKLSRAFRIISIYIYSRSIILPFWKTRTMHRVKILTQLWPIPGLKRGWVNLIAHFPTVLILARIVDSRTNPGCAR